jgi:RNA polymerase sigma factor (sigma-70 family)
VGKKRDQEYCTDFNKVLKGCSKGDLKAQEYLFKQYYSYVMSVALRFSSCYDNALEIVNDSFLKIFSEIDSHRADKKFKAWVRKIVVNTAIDYFRKNRRNSIEIPYEVAFNELTDESVIEDLNAEEIISLINSLPVKYRYTFSLYEFEGFSHDEIALQLGITASTSRSNLTRAKKMLRQMIQIHYHYESKVGG